MKINILKYVLTVLCIIAFIAGCTAERQYNFTLKNTLSIFLLKNENGYYFCIPVQYTGDYQVNSFDFTRGYILIGECEIPLIREELNIYTFANEEIDETANYSEEFNHFYIFIEKHLNDEDMTNITVEYKKGNVISMMSIEYDLTIDNEPQNGNGIIDDFELYIGPATDPAIFPQNLDFFKARYLE
ncbi:MAG: hypothetical protein FWC01_07320 [Treponema sp.]|nr:hypothetical protein [Treponema sp.]MCL2237649.1 hypothetical protein [Treponema sp.]